MGEYLLKQNVVVVQPSKGKFNENITRNATLEGCYDQIFARFGSKIAKTDYFQEFYFS